MKKLVVAVSGGVDSVVLLHILMQQKFDLVVAHFDHGIRPESDADARFVAGLAKLNGLPFESQRVELGSNASEDQARQARYQFLRQISDKYDAQLVTAHHADDVVETIAINLQRGTGWRGIAALGDVSVWRPLSRYRKQDLYEYAIKHNLEWCDDETNQTDKYLRNRLRHQLNRQLSGDDHRDLIELWREQKRLKTAIDREVAALDKADYSSRYFMTMIDDVAAMEILRAICLHQFGFHPLTSQLARGVLAIKVARPGSSHQLGDGITLLCDKSTWSIQVG